MPNAIGRELNRKIRSSFLSGEIGVGSHNFVAFVAPADAERAIALTGIDAALISLDIQAKSLNILILENKLIDQNSLVNHSVNDLRPEAVIFFPIDQPATAGSQVNLFLDRLNFPFRFIKGYSYSVLFYFVIGGAGGGNVTLDLTVRGYYEEQEQLKTFYGQPR